MAESIIFRATVTRIISGNVYVEVPTLGVGREFGPVLGDNINYAPGQAVIVGRIDEVPEDLVLLGSLNDLPGGGGGGFEPVLTDEDTGDILIHDGTNFVNQLGTDIFEPRNTTLDALAAAGTGIAKLPWYNAVGSAQLTNLTAFGRTLIDDADASTALTTLGLSAFVKTIMDDADASAVLSTLGVSTFIKTLLDDADAATARTTLGAASQMTGEIKMWPTSSIPTGWLLCDGTVYNISTYPTLGALLGSTFGGNGTTTFGVPNFTDQFPIGASGTKALGTSGGSATKAVPAHTHTITDHDHGVGTLDTATVAHAGAQDAATTGGANRIGTIGGSFSGTHRHNVTGRTGTNGPGSTNAASGSAFDIMPPWRAINFIIRT